MKGSHRNKSFDIVSPRNDYNYFDYRCEFDVPKFVDLDAEDQLYAVETKEIFAWFHTPHDFDVSSNLVAKHNVEMLQNATNYYT